MAYLYFNIDFPVSAQFGALGSIIGHEIGHGFDVYNIDFDIEGKKRPWMDKQSKVGFNKMADCLAKQYRKFNVFPLASQGENMAENAGIRSAYNACMAYQNLHGAQPRIPHPIFKNFTHEQLFFIAYSQRHCSKTPIVDTGDHLPYFYRIMVSMQNFPAFRAAFNCPVGSKYSPKDYCDVWT